MEKAGELFIRNSWSIIVWMNERMNKPVQGTRSLSVLA
jgi:hypothetical protein